MAIDLSSPQFAEWMRVYIKWLCTTYGITRTVVAHIVGIPPSALHTIQFKLDTTPRLDREQAVADKLFGGDLQALREAAAAKRMVPVSNAAISEAKAAARAGAIIATPSAVVSINVPPPNDRPARPTYLTRGPILAFARVHGVDPAVIAAVEAIDVGPDDPGSAFWQQALLDYSTMAKEFVLAEKETAKNPGYRHQSKTHLVTEERLRSGVIAISPQTPGKIRGSEK